MALISRIELYSAPGQLLVSERSLAVEHLSQEAKFASPIQFGSETGTVRQYVLQIRISHNQTVNQMRTNLPCPRRKAANSVDTNLTIGAQPRLVVLSIKAWPHIMYLDKRSVSRTVPSSQ